MSTNVTKYTGSIPFVVPASRTSPMKNVSHLMNDEDRLVSQLRAGEEEACETVVTHYQETLIRMARRYVANRATAEKVVQESWMAVMNGLNRFESRSSLHAWICGILITRQRIEASERNDRKSSQTSNRKPKDGAANPTSLDSDHAGRGPGRQRSPSSFGTTIASCDRWRRSMTTRLLSLV